MVQKFTVSAKCGCEPAGYDFCKNGSIFVNFSRFSLRNQENSKSVTTDFFSTHQINTGYGGMSMSEEERMYSGPAALS
jgi:hypothetical protein